MTRATTLKREKFEVAAIKDTRQGGYSLFSVVGKHKCDQMLEIGSFLLNGHYLGSALLYHPLPLLLYSTVTLSSSQPGRKILSNVYIN